MRPFCGLAARRAARLDSRLHWEGAKRLERKRLEAERQAIVEVTAPLPEDDREPPEPIDDDDLDVE
jgi:hypothetical protein